MPQTLIFPSADAVTRLSLTACNAHTVLECICTVAIHSNDESSKTFNAPLCPPANILPGALARDATPRSCAMIVERQHMACTSNKDRCNGAGRGAGGVMSRSSG